MNITHQELIRECINIFPHCVIVTDRDGVLVYVNRYVCDLLEYDELSLLGRNWIEKCIPYKEQQRVLTVKTAILSQINLQQFSIFENSILSKTGNEYLIRWRHVPIYDGHEYPVGLLSIGENVSDKVNQERELSVYRDLFSHIFVQHSYAVPNLEQYVQREISLLREIDEGKLRIQSLTRALVSALENANALNDSDTGEHLRHIAELSGKLGMYAGCEEEFVKKLILYAPLHDVGKVGIDDTILKKPGRYTPEEYEKMKKHVDIGARILSDPEIDKMAFNIAKYHHEWWNGTGYICGLKAYDIPLEARIVAIVDVYDALRSIRIYKPSYTREESIEIMREESGIHFDPALFGVFLKLLESIDII